MILRRLTEHVKAQNWFAVAIDFVIVVVGVFIGIQVSNWNAAQAERRRAALVLDRLRVDFETIEKEAMLSVAYHKRNLDGLQTVIETLHSGELPPEKEEAFRIGLRYSYMHRNADGRAGTFVEILSSGQVALVRNEPLRAALITYDNEVQKSEQVMTQIRMHQSAHVAAFTLYYDYEIPLLPIDAETGTLPSTPVGEYDLPAMLVDRDFRNAAFELREANGYYYNWHVRNLNRARDVIRLLDAVRSGNSP